MVTKCKESRLKGPSFDDTPKGYTMKAIAFSKAISQKEFHGT
jgi:hypothetical protein